MNILFVCSANVGRSQIAEGLYNHLTNSKFGSSAAAREDVGVNYNFKPAEGIIQVMQEMHIDISQQRIKMLTEEMIHKADKVIVFCELDSLCQPFLLNSEKVTCIEIQDGVKHTIQEYRIMRDSIVKVINDLLN